MGIAATVALLAVLAVITIWKDIDAAWLATAGAGMVGAVLSVLQRMTSGSLSVSAEADRGLVWKVGLCRPLVGLTLGVVSYVLLVGGLVSLSPPDNVSEPLFFAGIAFLAGFSERFARDMMAAPTRLLSAAQGDETTNASKARTRKPSAR
jgi:hypothetical protein